MKMSGVQTGEDAYKEFCKGFKKAEPKAALIPREERPLVTIRSADWRRDYHAEYTERNHDMLWDEVDEFGDRSILDFEDALNGEYTDDNPRLQMSNEQRDYFQNQILLHILTELRILRCHLIRLYRDVT